LKKQIIIIGAGPAGIAAAVQAGLFGLNAAVMDHNDPGGLIECAHFVKNFPGYPEGIKGRDLSVLMAKHFVNSKIEFLKTHVESIDKSNGVFSVRTDSGVYESEYVVLASGTRPDMLPENIKLCGFAELMPPGCGAGDAHVSRVVRNMPGYSRFTSKRVHNDIRSLSRNLNPKETSRVIVLGSGDLAVDYSLTLMDRGVRPAIVSRTARLKASSHLAEAAAGRRIDITFDFITEKIEAYRQGIILSGGSTSLSGDYLLISIGRVPAIDFLSEKLYKSVASSSGVPGFFLAGDVRQGIFRQTAIAAGDGIKAIMKIARRLETGNGAIL